MQKYLNARAIDFSVPIVDEQGDFAVVSRVDWTLFDEKMKVVSDGYFTPEPEVQSSDINLTAESCTILNGMNSEVRMLQISLHLTDRIIINEEYFTLQKQQFVVIH